MTTATSRGEIKASMSKVMAQVADAADQGETEVVDDLQSLIEAQLEAALDQALSSPDTQTAGPDRWWDIYAYGAFSSPVPTVPHFAKPNQIVQLGQTVTVYSILVLNPIVGDGSLLGGGGLSSRDILGTALLPYRLNYDVANVTAWAKAGGGTITGNLSPLGFSVNAIQFKPTSVGLHEMNIRAQILSALKTTMASFAGYASLVYEIDSSLFTGGFHTHYQEPIRFDVYA